MKAVRLIGIRKMKQFEMPEPEILKTTDVKIRMKVMGVCGSDIHYFNHGNIGTQIISYPFTVGHEGAGIVSEVGSDVTKVKPGDRIAIEPSMPCFKCDQCLSGRHHTCRKITFLGNPGQSEGLMAEYIVMPETSCIPIPDSMTFDEAAITEPLAIGIYAVQQSGGVKGKSIGILGAGPIGESVLAPAIAEGVGKSYVTDKLDIRNEYALRNGAAWAGNPVQMDIVREILSTEPLGLDIVFECCGQPDALDQSLKLLKPGGKLMLIGIPESNTVSFNINLLRHKEITVVNVRRQNGCVEKAIKLIHDKKVAVEHWATHRFPLANSQDAFEFVAEYKDGVLKAMIDF